MKIWLQNKHLRNILLFAIIFLSALALRIPQLYSKYFILDGDEAIVGLMAKHFSKGQEFPLYFYGQSYGLALPEVVISAAAFQLFGQTDWAMKLAMLFLWSVGCFFLYKAFEYQGISRPVALLSLAVLLTIPAWLVWSMKARGGYLTAFTASSLIILLLLQKDRISVIRNLAIGFLGGLIYKAQPLWLPGLLPLVLYANLKNKQWQNLISLTVGGAVFFLLLMVFPDNSSDFWKPPVLGKPQIKNLLNLPELLFQNLTGFYYIDEIRDAPWGVYWLSILLIVALGLCLVFSLILIIKRKRLEWIQIAAISVLATLSYVPFVPYYMPRYLLPISGFVLLLMVLSTKHLPVRLAQLVFSTMIVIGIVSAFQFKNYRLSYYDVSSSEKELLGDMIEFLEKKQVQHVFSRRALLHWQLMFYSDERIVGRYKHVTDRYPKYVERVNSAYQSKQPTAMIGYIGDFDKLENKTNSEVCLIRLNSKYDLYLCPDKLAFSTYGFKF